MRRSVWGALALSLLLLQAGGQAQTNRVTFENITFAGSSLGFTGTTIRPSGEPEMTVCTGKLETAQIRIRWDGTAPTASVGEPVDVGDVLTIRGLAYLTDFRGIRTGATSGVVQFHCQRQ